MSAQQEARLKAMIGEADDPNVRADLDAISRALRGVSKSDALTEPPGTPVPVTLPR